MNEVEQLLKSRNITELCYIVANYVCKNKVKELSRFFINQFSTFYISNNVHVLFAIWKRLKRVSDVIDHSSEKDSKTLFNNRSIRINICELFILLTQINRSPNAFQFRNTRQKIDKMDCPMHFTLRSDDGTITDVHNFLYEMKIPHHKFELFKNLVYICSTFQNNQLCMILNGFLNDMELISNLEAYSISIYDMLFKICYQLCLPERRNVCKIMENMFNLYNNSKICCTLRFNLLLMCYDYCFSSDIYSKYDYSNKYVKPLIIQTAIKIDYIYCENEKNFPKLSISEDKETCSKKDCKKDKKDEKNNDNCEERSLYEIVLFSTPFICNNRPKPYCTPYIYDRSMSKLVDIADMRSNKIKYHIKKNNEQTFR